jgi:ribosomal protein S18 acetylase RimI-like enzyme
MIVAGPIAPVETADLPGIRRLIEAAIRGGVAQTEAEVAFLLDDIGQSLDEWVAAPAGKLHLKYVEGGTIVGVILVKDWWNLTNLFVDPGCQRRGVGRALMTYVLAECRGRSPRAALLVNSSANAVGFYRRLGFVASGEPRDRIGGCVPLRYDFGSLMDDVIQGSRPDLQPAARPADIDLARQLFREYAAEIGVDLCFQGFGAELASLPGDYAPPAGRLLLARQDGAVIGCGALRPLRAGVAEVKRLYVRPAHRGSGAGRAIAAQLIAQAAAIGYRSVVLDTLPTMTAAIALYESLGFRRRGDYYDTPLAGTVFMEREL